MYTRVLYDMRGKVVACTERTAERGKQQQQQQQQRRRPLLIALVVPSNPSSITPQAGTVKCRTTTNADVKERFNVKEQEQPRQCPAVLPPLHHP